MTHGHSPKAQIRPRGSDGRPTPPLLLWVSTKGVGEGWIAGEGQAWGGSGPSGEEEAIVRGAGFGDTERPHGGGSENPFRPHKRKKRLKENILCVILPRKIHSGCLLVQRHIAAKINQDERNSTARDGEPLGLCLGIKAACVAPEPLGMIL